jgi:hypothetical protein
MISISITAAAYARGVVADTQGVEMPDGLDKFVFDAHLGVAAVKGLRLSLGRLLRAHLLRLAEFVLPEESSVFVRGGATAAFKIDGKLIVYEGRRTQ